MRISVIISNFNGARFLPKLLDSLRAQTLAPAELFVVDRESHDASRDILSAFSGIRCLSHPAAAGLVSGYAAGARAATGDAFFFANEDLWLDSLALERLSLALNADGDIAAADPWQWSYDGAQWVHGAVRFIPARWDLASPCPLFGARFTEEAAEGAPTAFASAGAFLIRRKAFDDAGGWDESFFLDFEDVDLGIRLWQRGWRSVSVPTARVYHHVNAANVHVLPGTREPVSRRRYISARSNRAMVAWKHFSPWAIPAATLQGPVEFLNNLRRGRFRQALWDVRADLDVARRLPAARAYRAANAVLRRRRPGEAFFAAPEFSVATGVRR